MIAALDPHPSLRPIILSMVRAPAGVPLQTRRIDGSWFTVGSSLQADWPLTEAALALAPCHFVVHVKDDGYAVLDMSGDADLNLNGRPVSAADMPLHLHDRISAGPVEWTVLADDTAGAQDEKVPSAPYDIYDGRPYHLPEDDPVPVAAAKPGLMQAVVAALRQRVQAAVHRQRRTAGDADDDWPDVAALMLPAAPVDLPVAPPSPAVLSDDDDPFGPVAPVPQPVAAAPARARSAEPPLTGGPAANADAGQHNHLATLSGFIRRQPRRPAVGGAPEPKMSVPPAGPPSLSAVELIIGHGTCLGIVVCGIVLAVGLHMALDLAGQHGFSPTAVMVITIVDFAALICLAAILLAFLVMSTILTLTGMARQTVVINFDQCIWFRRERRRQADEDGRLPLL